MASSKATFRPKVPKAEYFEPHCAYMAVRLTDYLEALALAPFPDLDLDTTVDPPSRAEGGRARVRAVIDQAALWADAIADICGPPVPHSRMISQNDLAGWTLKQLYLNPNVRHVGMNLRYVLGAPPSFLPDECGASLLQAMRAGEAEDPLSLFYDEPDLDDRVALLSWNHKIRSEVEAAYQVVRMQALSLVQWVREGVDALRNATLPLITVPADDKKSRTVNITVSLAGRSRDRDVTATHAAFLRELAAKGAARAHRSKIKGAGNAALEGRVPELRGQITSMPGSSQEADQTAVYRVTEEQRRRILVS